MIRRHPGPDRPVTIMGFVTGGNGGWWENGAGRSHGFVIARSEATKQSRLFLREKSLDCFAALAMTSKTRSGVLAARNARGLHLACPQKIRGRGEGRVFCAPIAARAVKKAHALVTTGP